MEEPNNEEGEYEVIILTVDTVRQILLCSAIINWSTRLVYLITAYYVALTIFYNELYVTPDIVASAALAFILRAYVHFLSREKYAGIFYAIQVFVKKMKETL